MMIEHKQAALPFFANITLPHRSRQRDVGAEVLPNDRL